MVETQEERELLGKATATPWMQQAAAEGLPTAHLGGVGGFTALADGIDRAMAGLEPGFEPQILHEMPPKQPVAGLGSVTAPRKQVRTSFEASPEPRVKQLAMHDQEALAVDLAGEKRGFESPRPLAYDKL